jgi:mono/diheme cytochrome c family protein
LCDRGALPGTRGTPNEWEGWGAISGPPIPLIRRPLLALTVAIALIGLFTGGVAWLLDSPRPPRSAPRAERLYYGLCATCHGADGRGSWRAWLFLVRPGNLADVTRMQAMSDQYLFDLIAHGGAPIGRPGMPAFGAALSNAEIRELVQYLRGLARGATSGPHATSPAS